MFCFVNLKRTSTEKLGVVNDVIGKIDRYFIFILPNYCTDELNCHMPLLL